MSNANCDIDDLLKLSIDKQKLNAVLRIEPNPSNIPITQDALCAYLEGSDIHAQCILNKEIDQLAELAMAEPHHAHEMIVVKGKPPVEGINAGFEFSDELKARIENIAKREEAYRKAEQENTLPTDADNEDNEKTIDFYNESPFLIVSKGDLIGSIVEASPGEDGINVHGQAIPTKPGKDLPDLIDSSLKLDDQGNVHARIAGHLTHAGMRIRISPTLEVGSYVDFSTGNIDFPSEVIVNEGVRDRFCVKAGENIEIRKLVEASALDSSQDIILHNGMAGRDTGTIRTGRDLKAGYLEGVEASIAGRCEVQKEITNCKIMIAGTLESPNAALRGGETCISKGGTIGSIGSVQGVKTDVIVGWIPEIEKKIRLAQDLRPKIEAAIAKQTQEFETLKKSLGKPSREQETEIEFMKFEIGIIESKLVDLDSAIDRLGQIIREHAAHKLNVKSMIFAKTIIWLPGFKITFENDVKGELSLDLNKSGKPIVTRNGNSEPMNTIARVIADDRVLPIVPPKQDEFISDDSNDEFTQAA